MTAWLLILDLDPLLLPPKGRYRWIWIHFCFDLLGEDSSGRDVRSRRPPDSFAEICDSFVFS
jgi:hypothetical protein